MLSDREKEGANDVAYSLSYTRRSVDGDDRCVGDTESTVLSVFLENKLTYMYQPEGRYFVYNIPDSLIMWNSFPRAVRQEIGICIKMCSTKLAYIMKDIWNANKFYSVVYCEKK
jgi:hypothetical protein